MAVLLAVAAAAMLVGVDPGDPPGSAASSASEGPDAMAERAAEEDVRLVLAIRPAPLAEVLQALSARAGVTVLARSEDVDGRDSAGLTDITTLRDALASVLAPHGLEARPAGEAWVVERRLETSATRPADPPTQPPAPQGAPPRDIILVTGYRSSQMADIQAKRRAEGIVDAASHDRVTLLPDLTVSDAARRIVGVTSIPRDGTMTTRKIEGSQNVLIRGLDSSYIQATIDGAPFAAASAADRAADLSLFPPTAIARIEAIKTLSADLDPHGLTGRLDLRTASALDYPAPATALRLSAGRNSLAGDVLAPQGPNLRGSLLHVRPPAAPDGWGVALAGSYERFHATSADARPGAESGTYLFYGAASDAGRVSNFIESDGRPAAARNQLYLFETDQERASAFIKLERSAGERGSASLIAALFAQDETEVRHEHLVIAPGAAPPVERSAVSGTWLNAQPESGYVYQPQRTLTGLVGFRLTGRPVAGGEVRLDLSASRSSLDVRRDMSKFVLGSTRTGFQRDTVVSYRFAEDGSVSLDFADADRANTLSRYTNSYIRDRSEAARQSLVWLNSAWAGGSLAGGEGWGAEIGASFTLRQQSFDAFYAEGLVSDTEGCTAARVTDCPLATLADYAVSKRFPSFDPDVGFYLVDDRALRAAWRRQGGLLSVDRTAESVSSDYRLHEGVAGVWARIAHATPGRRVEAGLRRDEARADVDLFLRDERAPADERFVPTARSYEYGYWLPSALLRFDVADDLVLRLGYSRTLGRPDIPDLTRGERIRPPQDGRVRISRGNPDLKPLRAHNFDLSVERYFEEIGGVASLALFYKSVDDLIFVRSTEIADFQLDGETLTATVTQPVNAAEASLYGAELSLRTSLDPWLPVPGVTLDANLTRTGSDFTYLDAEGAARDPGGWVNQPRLVFNVALAWEGDRLGVRLAHNHVGEYLSNILSDTGDLYDTYALARGATDLQVRYRLGSAATLVAEVQNLGETDLVFVRRFPFGDLLATRAERGRVLWIGASMER